MSEDKELHFEFRTYGYSYGNFDPVDFKGMTIDEACEAIVDALGDYGEVDSDDVMSAAEQLVEAANGATVAE